MVYALVFALSLAVGGLVYWLTLRAGSTLTEPPLDGDGFLPEPPMSAGSLHDMPPPPDGTAYVAIGRDRRSWQTRVVGALGLIILVSLAAAVLAFTLFQAGSMVARLLSSYASGG